MIKFFLNRSVLSIVISLAITISGIVCLNFLPVEQLPNLSPPVISIFARYSGASAETIARSVADPLESAVIGAENLIYMTSGSSSPGNMSLSAYFRTGTNPHLAKADIQNRVNSVMKFLPEEVQKSGITVADSSSNIFLFVALQDSQGLYNKMFVTNYATLHIVPEIQRIPGVSVVSVINASDYSMRIWLQPDRLAQFKLAPSDIRDAILEQNATRSIGEIGQEPSPPGTKLQLTLPVSASGGLNDVNEFENVIIRANPDGSMILLKDVSRVELGAQSYDTYATLNGKPGAFISIEKTSGANALEVAKEIKEKLDQLSHFFPPGLSTSIPYDTTIYIDNSIKEVIKTLIEAAILVSLVIFLFLQDLRLVLIPIIAMIVSIVGTFLGMYLLGLSINTLSLFGLILAIGIVVDDAIVVVESIELHMRGLGLSVKDAILKTMENVRGPIIAIVFALAAIFFPVTFMEGIAGGLYKQFAVPIVISVFISGFVALTLSPVLALIFLKNISQPKKFGKAFNKTFSNITKKYVQGVHWLIYKKGVAIGLWLLILLGIGVIFQTVPLGFIPPEDQGAILIAVNLPDGASLNRTIEVSSQVDRIIKTQAGIQDSIAFSGAGGSNSGAYYLRLENWNQRKTDDLQASQILDHLNQKLSQIPEAEIIAYNLPPIPGVGTSDFYDFWVINKSGATPEKVVDQIIEKGKKRSEFSYLGASTAPYSLGLFLDIDKIKAKAFGIKLDNIFSTLQMLLGSIYINDFNQYGKSYKVIAQAEPTFRDSVDHIVDISIPSSSQEMIPLKSFVIPKFLNVPSSVTHFNGTPAIHFSVGLAASSEKVMSAMEEIAKESLLPGMSFAWSGTALEVRAAKGGVVFAFLGGLLMLFLTLAALYNRWILPLIVFLAIPFAILGALIAVWMQGIAMDLYFQIGLIASIGISAKNAILIVEYARLKRNEGMGVIQAACEAARLRFRAILMTSLTLILAMFPLTLSGGAGAASKHSVGTGVLGGIFLATLFAIFFVPFFFRLLDREKG